MRIFFLDIWWPPDRSKDSKNWTQAQNQPGINGYQGEMREKCDVSIRNFASQQGARPSIWATKNSSLAFDAAFSPESTAPSMKPCSSALCSPSQCPFPGALEAAREGGTMAPAGTAHRRLVCNDLPAAYRSMAMGFER
jgi:hypothetical protein